MEIASRLTYWKTPQRLEAAIVSLILVVSCLAGAKAVYEYSGIKVGPNDFNIPAWELRNIPGKWLFEVGEVFREPRSTERQDADIQRFFTLTHEIDALEETVGDATSRGANLPDAERDLQDKRRERDALENYVEATIEARVTAAIKQAGITRDFGPLGNVVWPPVDFELTVSPRSLVTSSRDRLEVRGARLIREGLTIEEVERIEAATQRRDGVSALAFPTGGIGAYPTVIDYPSNYKQALEVVAHEWMHNYLTFRPLGLHYYESGALRSINETVADLVGHELAASIIARWPVADSPYPPRITQREQPAGQPRPRIDVPAELRALRGEVEAMLDEGKVTEAEALMEQRRQDFLRRGVYFRKLNQAYFAFTNLYAGAAGNPAAVNPIGPKIDDLRKRAGSLARFVQIVGGVTSVAGLDRALESLPPAVP